MAETLAQRVVNSFGLTKDQRTSALERGKNIVVTGGAGRGKTRTLVARYASLLADGLSPRQVVAITFTEKAAREMRSRLRGALLDLVSKADSIDEHAYWTSLNNQMDSILSFLKNFLPLHMHLQVYNKELMEAPIISFDHYIQSFLL